jgi:hypothetical protein
MVASLLKPGGRLYLAESHPAILCFDWVDGRIAPRFDWRTPRDTPFADEVPTTYTGAPDLLENKRVYEWIHPLSDIFQGLITAGLRIERFTEHAALPWPLFPNMTKGEDGLYRLPPDHPQLPLSVSLDATRI